MILRDDFHIRPSTGMAMLIALLVLGGCSTSTPHVYDKTQEIEHRYSGAGPYRVMSVKLPAVYGEPGGMAYLPESPSGSAPLIVWQNGTGEPIGTYDGIARHLASWGLAVIGSNDRQMGSGQRAITLRDNAALWSATPDHPLYGRIASETFAFVGSSQGAVGAINAHTRFATGRRAAALAIHGTPTKEAIDFFRLDLDYDTRKITAPLLILTGTEDEFISPIQLNQTIFDSLPGPGLRVLGVAEGADHIELAGDAGRFRGYLTAWLTFQLLGDPGAAEAFVGRTEITSNPDWVRADVSR